MAILDRTRMNLARQFLRTPAIIRPYIRSVLCRDISQLSSAGEERLFGSLDST